MRYSLLFFLIFYCSVTVGQGNVKSNIDTSNYYSFYSTGDDVKGENLTTNWLRLDDAIMVIIDEMKKAGFKSVTSKKAYMIDSTQKVTLAAYSEKDNVGFLYNEDHEAFPDKKHRQNILKLIYTNFDGDNFIIVKKSPPNIFILSENLYWYQYTDDKADNNKLLTKEDAVKILRMDVQMFLSQIKRKPF